MDDPYPSLMLLVEINQVSASYIIANIAIFVLLLILSGLVSGTEVAFFSLNSDDISRFDDRDKSEGKVIMLLEAPKSLLSTVLILNNLINIGIVTLTTFFTWSLYGLNATGILIILVQTIGVTFAIVFFGEIVPKVYATKAKVEFAKMMAPPIYFFSLVLKPLSSLLMAMSNIIEKRIEKRGYSLSVDQLNQALEITTEDTTEEEKDILKGIVNFGTFSVGRLCSPEWISQQLKLKLISMS
jgi:putative hemolysin